MRVGARSVAAPDGTRWRVGRRWVARRLPRWRRVRIGDGAVETLGLPDVSGPDDLVTWLAILVGGLVVAVVLIPLLLFGLELVLVGVLLAAGILARALLGRPWVVQALGEDGRALTWQVSGWRRSALAIEQVAASLAAGLDPPAEL